MPQTDEHLQGPNATKQPAHKPLPPDVDPWAIAHDSTLDRDAKLAALHQLEWDVRLVENALQEGMTGNTTMPALTEVLAAMAEVAGDDANGVANRDGAAMGGASKI